jgi:hypothetical protein
VSNLDRVRRRYLRSAGSCAPVHGLRNRVSLVAGGAGVRQWRQGFVASVPETYRRSGTTSGSTSTSPPRLGVAAMRALLSRTGRFLVDIDLSLGASRDASGQGRALLPPTARHGEPPGPARAAGIRTCRRPVPCRADAYLLWRPCTMRP